MIDAQLSLSLARRGVADDDVQQPSGQKLWRSSSVIQRHGNPAVEQMEAKLQAADPTADDRNAFHDTTARKSLPQSYLVRLKPDST